MSDVDVQQQLVDYYQEKLAGRVEAFAKAVAETLKGNDEIRDHIRPLITWRAKDPESLRRKLREHYGPTGEHVPLSCHTLNEYVPDLGGVRVLVHDRDNLRAIGAAIEEQCARGGWVQMPGKVFVWDRAAWDVRELQEDPYVEIKDSPRGSYRSRHFVVREAVGTQIRCEIQLRTVLEEAVFEAHHRLIYRVRQEHRDPRPEAEQVLGALTEMLTVADSLLSDCYRWSREQ